MRQFRVAITRLRAAVAFVAPIARDGDNLDQRRELHHRQLFRRLRSVRFRRMMAALAEWAERGPLHPDVAGTPGHCCERELNRWRERLIRTGRRLRKLDASRRHRLRIRIKHFRYIVEAPHMAAICRIPSHHALEFGWFHLSAVAILDES